MPVSTSEDDQYVCAQCNYISYRDLLSPELDKLAYSKYLIAGEQHAGWITLDGDFYDVTEKLGLHSQGDFGEKKNYNAVGFEDNNFVFSENRPGGGYDYYYVPVNNISAEALVPGNPSEKADLLSDLLKPFSFNGYHINSNYITEWIDDTLCIVENEHTPQQSYILNITDHSDTREYIPETSSRQNWSGVLSPDGQTIAFLSHELGNRSEGTGSDLYTVPISGGEPTKIPTDLPFTYYHNDVGSSAITDIQSDMTCVTLIGWR